MTAMVRTVLSFTAILFALTGCSPAPESTSNVTRNLGQLQLVQKSETPEVTAEKISHDIVGRVVQAAELTGVGPETKWTFDANEFRQVDILEKHLSDTGLTLVIFMTTRDNPKPDEDQVQVTGKLQLRYEWKSGKWILTTIENLTFRYSVGLSA